LPDLFLTLSVIALAIYLFLALLFPALLPLLAVVLLLLAALLPALLPLLAVVLLLLPALLPALLLLNLLLLLLLNLLLLPGAFAFLAALFSFLRALVPLGLVFLAPLFAATAPSLCIGEVSRAQHRGRYRQRQSDLLQVFHFLFFLSVLSSGERSTFVTSATAIPLVIVRNVLCLRRFSETISFSDRTIWVTSPATDATDKGRSCKSVLISGKKVDRSLRSDDDWVIGSNVPGKSLSQAWSLPKLP